MTLAASPPAQGTLHSRRDIYDIVRLATAGVLLVAGLLKAQQMLSPVVASHRPWHILLIELEWVLALWLILGIRKRVAWMFTTLVFGVFSMVALYRGLRGDDSCGCFGDFRVSPWITFTLDLVIVAALLRWPPMSRRTTGPRVWRAGCFVLLPVAVASAAWAAHAMATYAPGRLQPDGRIVGDGRYIDLRPDLWVGQRFPLLDYLDIDHDLKTGRWSIMFYYHRCGLCHQTIGELIADAPHCPDPSVVERIVLIEYPPYGPMPESEEMRRLFKVGRLRDDGPQWFMTIPTWVKLEDGIVTAVAVRQPMRLPTAPLPTEPTTAPAGD
jgi:hypothetical protein